MDKLSGGRWPVAEPKQKPQSDQGWQDYSPQGNDWQDAEAAKPVDESQRLGSDNPNTDAIKSPEPGFVNTLGREAKAFGSAIAGIPSATYHAFADAPTEEEAADFGVPKQSITSGQHVGLGLHRMVTKPVMNALDWYSKAAHGQIPNAYEQALSVSPEAIGQGASAPVAAKMIEVGAQNIGRIPAGQIVRTTGKVLANTDLTKPLKAASKVPDYWRQSSPEAVEHIQAMRDPLRVQTKQAISEGRAMRIPLQKLGKKSGSTGSMAESVEPPVTFVPEPRAPFQGEDPNYMGSVPRDELGKMAVARKPGAGRQMQQLGKPIIYIPNEADYPGPR